MASQRFKHANKRGKTVQGHTDKAPVVTLVDTATGEARSHVVANVSGSNLRAVIQANVEMATSVLHTDSAPQYEAIGRDMAGHFAVDHKAGQYVTELARGTNKAENYFSQLKRKHRRDAPPRFRRTFASLPCRVRLPVLDARRERYRAHVSAGWSRRWQAA